MDVCIKVYINSIIKNMQLKLSNKWNIKIEVFFVRKGMLILFLNLKV